MTKLMPVLCQYRYFIKDTDGERWVQDGIMLHAAKSAEIPRLFKEKVKEQYDALTQRQISHYEMTKYLPECGKAKFG